MLPDMMAVFSGIERDVSAKLAVLTVRSTCSQLSPHDTVLVPMYNLGCSSAVLSKYSKVSVHKQYLSPSPTPIHFESRDSGLVRQQKCHARGFQWSLIVFPPGTQKIHDNREIYVNLGQTTEKKNYNTIFLP